MGESTGYPGWLKEGAMWKVHAALLVCQLNVSGFFVLAKASLSNGVDPFVFAVYRDALGTVLLAVAAYFLEKRPAPLTGYVTFLIFLAGLFGIFGTQLLFNAGIALTSAAYAGAMQAAIPMFTFLIAYIFRIEEINFAKRHGQAKLLGVCFSLCGALLMTFYQGLAILGSESSLGHRSAEKLPFHTSAEKLALYTPAFVAAAALKYGITAWQVGSACLVAATICLSISSNLQAPILHSYPSPVSETALFVLFGTLLLIVGGAFAVKDSSAWVLTSTLDIVAIAYAGIMVSALSFALGSWAFQRSGPFLVAAYIPLQPFVSAILGFVFIGEVIYLGSLLGAIAVLSGLYLITWGKVQSKEEAKQRNLLLAENSSNGSLDPQIEEPLLNEVQCA